MTRAIALLAAGYLARVAQKTRWTWPLIRVRCRIIKDSKYLTYCKNTVWRIRWDTLAPLSVVCRSCRKAGGG